MHKKSTTARKSGGDGVVVGRVQSFKVIVIGNSGTGKSSLVWRYKHGEFTPRAHSATIGTDFVSVTKTLQPEQQPVRLHLWDVAGQDNYTSMVNMFFRDASAAVILFDATNRRSFDDCARWRERMRTVLGNTDILCVVVEHKCDVADAHPERAIVEDNVKRLHLMDDGDYDEWFRASSKNGQGVEAIFEYVARELWRRHTERVSQLETYLDTEDTEDDGTVSLDDRSGAPMLDYGIARQGRSSSSCAC